MLIKHRCSLRGGYLQMMWLLVVIFTGPGFSTFSSAHDARPVAVTISELFPELFQATIQIPDSVEPDNLPVLVWPANCTLPAGSNSSLASGMVCAGGLEGRQFSLAFPLFNPSLASFYRLELPDGTSTSSMLPPTNPVWTVPAAMTPLRVAAQYLRLGVEHILGGLDHLLFVLGLLVIARTPRRILLTVTGFTVAHSITLSLSSLGIVRIPIIPVEAAIALSIVFLAHEISQQQANSFTWRFPLLVSFVFGLLHGLGFASALGEIGLADNEILLSLLFFNLGVEAGQILFIAAVVLLACIARQAVLIKTRQDVFSSALLMRRTDLLAAYIIGVPAAYWMIERLAGFIG